MAAGGAEGGSGPGAAMGIVRKSSHQFRTREASTSCSRRRRRPQIRVRLPPRPRRRPSRRSLSPALHLCTSGPGAAGPAPSPSACRPGPGPALPAVRLSLVRLGEPDGAGAEAARHARGAGRRRPRLLQLGPRALFLPGLLSPWEPTGERPAPWGPGCGQGMGTPEVIHK